MASKLGVSLPHSISFPFFPLPVSPLPVLHYIWGGQQIWTFYISHSVPIPISFPIHFHSLFFCHSLRTFLSPFSYSSTYLHTKHSLVSVRLSLFSFFFISFSLLHLFTILQFSISILFLNPNAHFFSPYHTIYFFSYLLPTLLYLTFPFQSPHRYFSNPFLDLFLVFSFVFHLPT